MQLLDKKYSDIVLREKLLLKSLEDEIKGLSSEELLKRLRSVQDNLDNLFSIVFIGEFSTGKSSIINALLGEDVLEEGITPTTDEITILKFGDVKEEGEVSGTRSVSLPQERLKGLYIVDTPGTNVTLEQHEKLTQDFIPRADIVFFTIGAERAVTGSEARLIQFIKEDWLKNIVFLLNKTDIAEGSGELEELVGYTNDELERIFKLKPHLIPVSAKLAREARARSDEALYEKSGFKELESYIFNTLGEEERVRIKIKSTSEFALSLATSTEETIAADIEKISNDESRLSDFEVKLGGMRDEIVGNSAQFTERIRARLLEFKTRGIEYIDDLIRFSNVLKLVSKSKVANEFELRVSRRTVEELEKDLDAMVMWTERSARTLLDSAIDFYNESIRPDSGPPGTAFTYDRTRLIDTVRSELEKKRAEIDPALLGGNLVDSARGAVASVLGVQAGTLALGAAVVSAFSSIIVDVTGILATLALMATAFAILPKKRRDAMKEFSAKVDALIEEITSSVSAQLERDLDGIRMQVLDSLVPLRNFYGTEKAKLADSLKRVEDIKEELTEISKSV